jgi:hypothetical protein
MEKEKLLEKGRLMKHQMEVNGKLHDPAALTPAKEPPVPIVQYRSLDGSQSGVTL